MRYLFMRRLRLRREGELMINYLGFKNPEMTKFVHEELKPMNLPDGTHNFIVMALKQGKIIQRTATKGKEVWEFDNKAKKLVIEVLRKDKNITQRVLKRMGEKHESMV